jgi:cytoskeleton protein RodZ
MSKKNNKDEQGFEQLDQVLPGELLRRARREKGMAAEEMALHVGITQTSLSALENDEYRRLPAPLYVKGYIRRYCSILGIHNNEALTSYDNLLREQGIPKIEPKIRLTGVVDKKFGHKKLVIFLVLALLAALLFVFWIVPSSRGVALNLFETQSSTSTIFSQKKSLTLTPPLPVESQKNGTLFDGEGSVDIDENNANVAVVAKLQRLQIHIIQQSWIEVLDARGDVLIADLKPSGSKVDVTGMPPFNVVLGYAPGVQLSYAGQQVTVTPISTDNTATLKIGEES